ncbi:MAG: translation elongation factor Ts [Gammaproteobacteria bacterium]|nr:translation elongation factor Ts [Gammaproteobacteria bacterium]MDH4252945.1 translation elongation factor Ts [Gammaproteobacteria bacterium]MDH5308369.1 translation elongation factor Ts [Gammaproteobacteria bacterium]
MSINASMVKELRERTGAGMMECKKALVEAGGNMDEAVELLRKSGQAKADKKASRVAADGRVIIAVDGSKAAIVEINSETDFVAKDENFASFADAVAKLALASGTEDVAKLNEQKLADGRTVETARTDLVAKVGENISVRRVAQVRAADHLGTYLHGGRIGAVVAMQGGDEDLARDIAMHVAASNPACVDERGVPADILERERRIFAEQAAESGKPADIVEKMVNGRIAKFLKEITLLGQPFVKDPDTSVDKLLKKAGATVASFVRFEVGEGIEKKEENFADEVMKQVKGGA